MGDGVIMIKKIISLLILALLLLGFTYQNSRLSDARREAVNSYKTSIYHLQVVNDIMIDKIKSGIYNTVELQGVANRCVDLGILSYDLGIPANNYYFRLTDGFIELSESINDDNKENTEKLTKEMTFLLDTLKELYSLISRETEGNANETYKKLYINRDINQKASEYLDFQEKIYYK